MSYRIRLTKAAAVFYISVSVITIIACGAIVGNAASGNSIFPSGSGTEIVQPVQQDDAPEAEPAFPLTANERDLVERIVAAESRGESLEGQMAVAQVIYCRSSLWGQSITQVCTAKSQFAKPYSGTVSDKTKQAVSLVFDEGQFAIDGPVTHFFAHKQCYPSWAKSKTVMAVIGSHTFMY